MQHAHFLVENASMETHVHLIKHINETTISDQNFGQCGHLYKPALFSRSWSAVQAPSCRILTEMR